MARKKSLNDLDNDPIIPNDDTELDESSIFEEEEDDSEDKGIDEILGGATLGRAAGDLDGWGSSEYEDNQSADFPFYVTTFTPPEKRLLMAAFFAAFFMQF